MTAKYTQSRSLKFRKDHPWLFVSKSGAHFASGTIWLTANTEFYRPIKDQTGPEIKILFEEKKRKTFILHHV